MVRGFVIKMLTYTEPEFYKEVLTLKWLVTF
jgi:hypothetical protein